MVCCPDVIREFYRDISLGGTKTIRHVLSVSKKRCHVTLICF